MTHENDFQRIGDIAKPAAAGVEQRVSMTLAGMQAFDKKCAGYDLDVKGAKSALLRMTSIMPSPGTEQDPETRAAVYWDILKDELSPSAIARVCKRALAGDLESAKWLPVPGELIRFARNNWIQVGAIETDPRRPAPVQPRLPAPEHRRLGREYGDEQFNADERARIGRQLCTFADEMRARDIEIAAAEKPDYARRGPPVYSRQELKRMDAGEREKQRIEAETYLEAIRNKPLPAVSAELRAKLGIGVPGVAAE